MKGSLVILLKTNVEEMAVYRYPTMSMKIKWSNISLAMLMKI